MRTVGLKVLKNRLSEYIRIVGAGESVVVMDRDRAVAEIVPPRPGLNAALADAFWADSVRRGLITPAKVVSNEPPPRKPVMSFEELMRDLEADREDR